MNEFLKLKSGFIPVILALSLALVFCTEANADCQDRYQFLIKEADDASNANWAKSIFITVVNVLIPPTTILQVGTLIGKSVNTAEGIKIYISTTELKKIDALLSQAKTGAGEELDQIIELLKIDKSNIELESVIELINFYSTSYTYCQDDYTASYLDILRSVGVSEEVAKKRLNFLNQIHQTRKYPPRMGHP